ncbi:hypothetical protein K8I61_15105 [bacterium]|nr:hypothetical protein [bacterium]
MSFEPLRVPRPAAYAIVAALFGVVIYLAANLVTDEPAIYLDLTLEWDEARTDHEFYTMTNVEGDAPARQVVEIGVPCAVDRRTLVNHLRGALLAAENTAERDEPCIGARAWLVEYGDRRCGPIAAARFCPRGNIKPPWRFELMWRDPREIAPAGIDPWEFIDGVCRSAIKDVRCPFDPAAAVIPLQGMVLSEPVVIEREYRATGD